jgi:anti-sigma regulatory factor (Ser/Thr protein kinase)
VTFAQTWDVGYRTDDWPLASPRSRAASGSSRLVPEPPVAQSVSPQCLADLFAAIPGCVGQVLLAIGPESARAARDFTTSTLRDWQLDDLIEEAVLIASELVTNAIRHGRACSADQVELAWQRQASRVVCLVTDRSPLPPVIGVADRDAESGRGLQVVEALASTWGWTMLGATSKAVWAALAISR